MPRRIVTGEAADGTSFLASDDQVVKIEVDINPGAWFAPVWATDNTPLAPVDGANPPVMKWFPPVGGFRFFTFSLPPSNQPAPDGAVDADAAVAQANERLPGLLDADFDADVPGRHRSDTIDTMYVVSGTITLVLDDGNQVTAGPGDCIVQNATFHNWINPGNEPVVLVGAAIGVDDGRSGE